MELRDLRYFEALASELNFGRAAKLLHMTQPALSLAVARLEKEVGCALFQRTHYGVSLTQAGGVLLAETHGLQHAVERACGLARRAAIGDFGSLTVGFLDAAVFDVLPAAMRAFRSCYPAVELTLRQRTSSELITGVERGGLDVAFVRPDVPRAGLEMKPLVREDVIVALSRTHYLASRSSLRLADLAEEHFVFPEGKVAPSLYARWIDACANVMFSPQIIAHVSSAQIFVELIAQGIGIGFAAKSWLGRDDRVVARPLTDVQLGLEMALAYRPDRMSQACENFVALTLRQAQANAHLADLRLASADVPNSIAEEPHFDG
jgi:DNA-binding transcriptional LysR family regulator